MTKTLTKIERAALINDSGVGYSVEAVRVRKGEVHGCKEDGMWVFLGYVEEVKARLV